MKKKNGFSLTGVLIATGIGALIFGFIADMIIYQYKDQKHLSQKLEMTDFANTLIATFAKPGNCTCQFINNATNPNLANFGALHFDSTNVSGTESISVNKLFSGCLGGANPPILLAANNQPLHGSQDLIVDTVKLINLKPSGGGANPNDWQGQWQVIFKVASGSLNKPSPPVMVTQKFTIDPTVPTVALISSCNGISSGTGTTNFLAKWSGITGMLMDSGVYEEPLLKNVGIGTTAPLAPLHVSGATMRIDRAVISAISGPALDFYTGATHLAQVVPVADGVDGASLRFYTKLSGGILGAAKMSIDNAGNVGIGTTAPAAKLSINGNQTQNAGGAAVRITGIPGSSHSLEIGMNTNYVATANGWLQSWATVPTLAGQLLLNPNGGNVGIGTTAPVHGLLHVISTVTPNSAIYAESLDPASGSGISGFTANAAGIAVGGMNRATSAFGILGIGAFGVNCNQGSCGGNSAWIVTSDRRVKTDIQPVKEALNSILNLKGVTYHWRDKARDKKEGEKLGFIAQEVEEIFPQAITTDHGPKTLPGGTKMISYTDLISPIVEAIKEFYVNWSADSAEVHKEIVSIKKEMAQLKEENLQIKVELCKKDMSFVFCPK